MSKQLVEGVVGVLSLITLGIAVVLLIFICKPWRFFSSLRIRTIKVDAVDLERPLVLNVNNHQNPSDLEGAHKHRKKFLNSLLPQRFVCQPAVPSGTLQPLIQGDKLVLDVISASIEDSPQVAQVVGDASIGQTLKRTNAHEHFSEAENYAKDLESSYLKCLERDGVNEFVPNITADHRSWLSLEVVSGPSRGVRCSTNSSNVSKLPLTIGRVSCDLVVKDSEVSGRHAMINWNAHKKKWELLDMGSLNGTLLNSKPIGRSDAESRHWGDPVELSSGDIITLGSASNLRALVTSKSDCQASFGIGVACDPMSLRRGGKKLAMEDVCYYYWPLPGIDQFGVFGICDGHGGVAAAKSASKILPEKVASILSDSLTRQRVILQCDASDVLRVAFSETESSMNNYYEGCTATLLLVWSDGAGSLYTQCANVGDSFCVISGQGKQIKMTEDHRVSSPSEKVRINGSGEPLREGETRLCGLNLARMLGDKFLKQQESRFISDPYVSAAVRVDQGSFSIIASDGFWDVVSARKAFQIALQAKEAVVSADGVGVGIGFAERAAAALLSEARTQRTKDNTSILFLDFDSMCKLY